MKYTKTTIFVLITALNVVFMTVNIFAAPKDLLPDEKEYKLESPVPSRTYGVTWLNHESYAMAGHYGFTLSQNTANPSAMTLQTYVLDWDESAPDGKLVIQKITRTGITRTESILKENLNNNQTIAIKIPQDGIYTIAWKTNECTVRAYAQILNEKAYALRLNPEETITDGKEWDNLKNNINMDKALNTDIHYPSENQYDKNRIHREKEIKDLSDSLIKETETKAKRKLTPNEKVFVFTKYMQENYAYDTWRTTIDLSRTRANILDDYENPLSFTPDSHVGVCWDFACILNIMCRHHKIPAIGIMNSGHALSALYLDGEWVSFDISEIINKQCISKDIDPTKWIDKTDAYKWRKALACDPDITDIWITYDMWDNTKIEAISKTS